MNDSQTNEESVNRQYASPSLFRHFMYIFLFILFSLHGPYCYLIMRENLVVLADGTIDYDMGGIFPFTAVMIQALFFQLFATAIVFALSGLARLRARPSSVMIIAFISILGLQVLAYHNIYYDRFTDPQIIAARSLYPRSWAYLGLFSLYSIIRIIMFHRRENAWEADRLARIKELEGDGNHHELPPANLPEQ